MVAKLRLVPKFDGGVRPIVNMRHLKYTNRENDRLVAVTPAGKDTAWIDIAHQVLKFVSADNLAGSVTSADSIHSKLRKFKHDNAKNL